MTPRLWSRTAAAVAAALVLVSVSGCRAEVGTRVEVTGADTATVQVSAVFTDEAAQALAESTDARAELNDLFEARTGSRPEVSVADDRVSATATVPYSRVEQLADVTGVRYLALTEEGTVARVGFGPAERLVRVVREQNAAEPDADALSDTMLANTRLVVSVTYPGGVSWAKVVDGAGNPVPGASVHRSDNVAEFIRTADDRSAGELLVAGDPSGRPWLLWAGGLLVLLAGVVGWRRR